MTIQELIDKYPKLEYEDGYFYADSDSDAYLTDEDGKAFKAKEMLSEYFDGWSITLPNSGDPREDVTEVVSGSAYVKYVFEENWDRIFKYIKP